MDHGGEVSGFSERMKPGDYLLCYLTRVSRWIGVLEVTGEPFFVYVTIHRSGRLRCDDPLAWRVGSFLRCPAFAVVACPRGATH